MKTVYVDTPVDVVLQTFVQDNPFASYVIAVAVLLWVTHWLTHRA